MLTSITQKRLFILGSFIVLLLAVLLYVRINELVKSFEVVDQTNKIELYLESALSYMKDAETGQRGYLLTGDTSYLEPYYNARKRIDSVLVKLDSIISGDDQQQKLAFLKSQIDRRFFLLEDNLANADQPLDSLRFSLLLGKSTMDRIRSHVESMKKIEKNDFEKHEESSRYYARLTPQSLVLLVIVILIFLGFSYYGLTKQLKQTRTYAEDLDYLNNELILKNNLLESTIEELNSFNYIASHDLKEPLRKILFFTDLINNSETDLNPEMRQHVNKIIVAGERMKSLLDDLLTYAQASMGERKIEVVDLNCLLESVVDVLSEILKEKNAKVVYKNLPEINAVPSQIKQLFENLITNAVKYSREGVPPIITISSEIIAKRALPAAFEATQEWYHKILFNDNGIGFTQDNAEKIFVLFQRLHQRNEFSGTGIGLTICKKIIQNHNGFISAESEVNKGTTFTIYLPA